MSKKQQNILVVGDWMIDQNWVGGIHRSSTSSRTGKMHLRCFDMHDGAVDDLCGAGATAAVIFRAFKAAKIPVHITGIGIWNQNDTNYITNLLMPADERIMQPAGQITVNQNETPTKDIKLINIADCLNLKNISTTRIVRIYKHSRSNVEHLSRVDMESAIHENNPYWIMPDKKKGKSKSSSKMANKVLRKIPKKKYDAVVIKCLNKGVVSPELIKAIKKKCPGVPWYVSSKKWINQDDNDVLEALKGIDCKLFVIPQKAVDEAKRFGKTTKWLTGKGYETKDAIDQMTTIRDEFQKGHTKDTVPRPLITVFPAGHMILALNSQKEATAQGSLIIQRKRDTLTNPLPISTPFASIMFGALTALDLKKSNEEDSLDAELRLKRALSFTRAFIKQENNRILEPDEWDSNEEKVLDVTKQEINDQNSDWHSALLLEEAEGIWGNAFEGLGIIQKFVHPDYPDDEDPNKPEEKLIKKGPRLIELSRASVEVDGYICLDDEKRKSLQRLFTSLEKFKKDHRCKSASCLLKAPPGSGKTRLARSLAAASGYNFLDFNITLMNSRYDLINMFDRIATEQVKTNRKPLIVFVDEINASLENQPVYSSFLAPLEDGLYVRAEKKLHIDPCFWIFAGTIEGDEDEKQKEKWEDFQSRLTMSDIELLLSDEILGKGKGEWYGYEPEDLLKKRLEMVYIGATVLISTFDDVSEISEKVLFLFWILGGKKNLTNRQFVQFVKSFHDIQRGLVTSHNMNTAFFERRNGLMMPEAELGTLAREFSKYKNLVNLKFEEAAKKNVIRPYIKTVNKKKMIDIFDYLKQIPETENDIVKIKI